ncbi:MAG: peptidoglycan DD-metalloendopeptidase family protein [Saprospiraceae bacterium]
MTYSFTNSSESKNKDRIEFLKQQIKQTEEILAHLNTDKSNFIVQLNIRQGLINHRNELITGINTELEERSQELLNLELGNKLGLEKLEEYKKDYQKVARQKNIHRYSSPEFQIFEVVDWTSILKKLIWKEQLNKYRIQRFLLYKKSQETIVTKQKEIRTKIDQQKDLLNVQALEKNKLEQDFSELQKSYKDIQVKQKDYLSLIKKFNAEQSQLEKLINKSISESNSLASVKRINTSSAWSFPLKGGTITSRFGTFRDPQNKQLTIRNNGVDIRSSESFISAITDSEVIQIRQLPNGSFFLLTQVGDLYLVYSNLDKVLVKPSEKLHRGDNLGELKSSKGGAYELHFEVWRGKTVLDPMNYIGR